MSYLSAGYLSVCYLSAGHKGGRAAAGLYRRARLGWLHGPEGISTVLIYFWSRWR
jgi:hypothetical protein